MKSKEQYTRENIVSDMLKSVIIRFDFSGATNIKKYIDVLKRYEWVRNAFKTFIPIERRNITFSFNSNIANSGSLPNPSQDTDTIFRFSNCMIEENSQAILDIDEESICLHIDCRGDYHGSQSYTNFMATLLSSLIEFDTYITIKRIGIRKIDSQICNGIDGLTQYFDSDISLLHNIDKIGNFSNRIFTDIVNVGNCTYNHIQRIDNVSGDCKQLRVIIDTDGYFIPEKHPGLLDSIEDLSSFLYKDMQNPMFIMFRNCVTHDYLSKHIKS